MTPREIIVSNIEYSADDVIGFNFTNKDDRLNYFLSVGCDPAIETKHWEENNFEYYTDMWGNIWYRLKNASQKGEIYKPVLETWDDLNNLVLPDLYNPDYFKNTCEICASESDRFRVGGMQWPFSICRYMRKMEIYFMDLIAERDKIDILHNRVTEILEAMIDRYGEAGVDGIMFWEDLGVQDRLLLSPDMWRDIFRPLYERLTGCAHKYGIKVIQHSCGYNWELIDDLCEAGIDCLQFDQPTVYDMPELAVKLKKHRVGLFSPCDIQKVLPTGDKTLIEHETELLVKTFRGGFIAKDYGDLQGIGVKQEWDQWAYDTFIRVGK